MATDLDPTALLASHAGFVRNLVHSLVWDPGQADDVSQDVLVAALEHPPRQATSLRSWLRRVAERRALRARRAVARRQQRELVAARPEAVGAADQVASTQELVELLVRAVAALPEPYRTTVHQRYYADLSPRRIAELAGLSVATVKTRLQRALRLLRVALDREFGGERRQWCVALLPLAAGPAKAATTGSLFALGALLMAKVKVVAVGAGLALLASVTAFIAWPWLSGVANERRDAPAVADGMAPPAGGVAAESRGQEAPPQAVDSGARSPLSFAVEGRVLDPAGVPVADVDLQLWAGPHPQDDPSRWSSSHDLRSDAQGRYRFELTSAEEVLVRCSDQRWQATPWEHRVRAPATKVDLVVRRVPTAKLVVSVRDATTGQRIEAFDCTFHVSAEGAAAKDSLRGGVLPARANERGVVEQFVRCEYEKTTVVGIILRSPLAAGQTVHVRAGEEHHVEVVCRSGPEIRGRVLDRAGRPVAEAIVYAGGQELARGDEPFKAFRVKRVSGGVRTAADGTYVLRPSDAEAKLVTAWHAEHSAMTVPLARAYEIRLPGRGAIQGTLRRAGDQPWSEVEIVLDQERRARTDASGRFLFAGVEVGWRGLHVSSAKGESINQAVAGPWAVLVEAGKTADVVLQAGLPDVHLALVAEGSELPKLSAVVLIGNGSASSVRFARVQGASATLRGVVPGDYVLLSDAGHVAHCSIRGPQATAVLGASEIIVEATPGTRVYVTPQGASDLVHVAAHRIMRLQVPESGELRLAPLPAGSYTVVAKRGMPSRGVEAVGQTVTLSGRSARVRIGP